MVFLLCNVLFVLYGVTLGQHFDRFFVWCYHWTNFCFFSVVFSMTKFYFFHVALLSDKFYSPTIFCFFCVVIHLDSNLCFVSFVLCSTLG